MKNGTSRESTSIRPLAQSETPAATGVCPPKEIALEGLLESLLTMGSDERQRYLDKPIREDKDKERNEYFYTKCVDAMKNSNARVRDLLEEIDKGPIFHLCLASWEGDVEKIRVLLKQGVDVNQQDKGGWTALHYASWSGKPDAVIELLSGGANCEVQCKHSSKTPDNYAHLHKHESVRKIFRCFAVLCSLAEKGERSDSGIKEALVDNGLFDFPIVDPLREKKYQALIFILSYRPYQAQDENNPQRKAFETAKSSIMQAKQDADIKTALEILEKNAKSNHQMYGFFGGRLTTSRLATIAKNTLKEVFPGDTADDDPADDETKDFLCGISMFRLF